MKKIEHSHYQCHRRWTVIADTQKEQLLKTHKTLRRRRSKSCRQAGDSLRRLPHRSRTPQIFAGATRTIQQ